MRHRWRGEVTGFDWFKDRDGNPYKKYYAELTSLDGYPIPTWAYLDEHGVPVEQKHLKPNQPIIGFKFIWTIGKGVDEIKLI